MTLAWARAAHGCKSFLVAIGLLGVLLPIVPTESTAARPLSAARTAVTGCAGGHAANLFSRSSGWHRHVPLAGPSISMQNNCLILTVPATRTYGAWSATDNVPELLWADLGPVAADWTATTHLAVTNSGKTGDLQTGLVLRFDDSPTAAQPPTQVFWGLYQSSPTDPYTLQASANGNINAFGSTIGRVAKVPGADVALRVGFTYDAGKCVYHFAYRTAGSGGFTAIPETFASCTPLAGVGPFAQTSTPRAATTAFSWFTLDQARVRLRASRGRCRVTRFAR